MCFVDSIVMFFFEIETEENKELDTVEKLIKKINEIEIPIYKDNYFVKKAEVELDKRLNERTNKEISKNYFSDWHICDIRVTIFGGKI